MITLTVYEHRSYKVGDKCGDFTLEGVYLARLQAYYERNSRFYSLINNGVRFCAYVGVIKIGELTVEVLPKTDGSSDSKEVWQHFLIKMLKTSGIINISHSGFAALGVRHHSILDLYIEMFLGEVTYLLHNGLLKKYSKKEGNSSAMKGALLFSKNIQYNLVHAERFYVRYGVFDRDNLFNGLLRQTLQLVAGIGSIALAAKAREILMDFPECKKVAVEEATFNRLIYDRKTEGYRKAMNMARLLLLNYHPDIRRGGDDVLALMFDMNRLWERYVFKALKRVLQNQYQDKYLVNEQVINDFWKPEGQYMRTVRPDIVVLEAGGDNRPVVVLDTKWKVLKDNRADDADLKQMLVYNIYNSTKASALVYPSNGKRPEVSGLYQKDGYRCSLQFLPLVRSNGNLEIELDGILEFIERCFDGIL